MSLNGIGDTPAQTALLRYMKNSDGIIESEYFPNLVKRVQFLKETKEGELYMCEIMNRLIQEGRQEGRQELILKMKENNISEKMIAIIASISEEEVRKLQSTI